MKPTISIPMAYPSKAPLVFSLVYNPCVTDARVLKQAKSLTEAGCRVKIYARCATNTIDMEVIDGFEINRFDCYNSNFDFNSHTESIQQLFGDDAEQVFESCNQYSQSIQAIDSLRNLHKLTLRPPVTGLFKNTLGKFRTFNRLKDSASARILPTANTKKAAIHTAYEDCLEPLVNARGKSFFYANYYLYCINLLALDFDEKPDIIHAHDLYTLPAAVALRNITGAKLVYDAHELEAERAPPLTPIKKGFISRIEKKLLIEADGMITVSESIARVYEEKVALARKPTLVLNSPVMHQTQKHSEISDIRELTGLSKETPIVVFTGGVSRENRGMDKVVQSLALLPKFHLVVMGPSNRANDQWLLDTAKNSNVTEQVHFLPPVPHSHVVQAISSGDIGIIAAQDVTLSYRYALPNKLFEMTFAGLPLCVANLVEMKNFVIENEVGIWMDQTDPKAIASAIQKVYDKRQLYTPNKDKLALIIEKYEWKQQALNLTNLYSELLEESSL